MARSVIPFCGCHEADTEEATEGKWSKRNLRWLIQSDLPGVLRNVFADVARQAFASWQAVCGLTFEEVTSGNADILISTGKIDTAGATLAWSELPNGSDQPIQQKYDTSERWNVDAQLDSGEIDLLAVMVHELGHGAIGLQHGSAGIMRPYYDPKVRVPMQPDIERAVAKYGPPVTTPVPTPTVPPGGGSTIKIQITDPNRCVFSVAGKLYEVTVDGAASIVIPGFKVTRV